MVCMLKYISSVFIFEIHHTVLVYMSEYRLLAFETHTQYTYINNEYKRHAYLDESLYYIHTQMRMYYMYFLINILCMQERDRDVIYLQIKIQLIYISTRDYYQNKVYVFCQHEIKIDTYS